ncbi:MAG: M28 family peptidase [Planctomycetota bacterium]|nr:M28 family peptidase [Planctomycetota bacterium]
MRPSHLAPILLTIAACSAPAGAPPGGTGAQMGASSASSRAVVLRAEAPRLAADVAWLADDARYGRRAGTPGEDAARDFLVARFLALGLEPAGEQGYLQAFEVPLPAVDGGASRLEWSTHAEGVDDPQLGRAKQATDLVPLFCSGGGEAVGELVWVGFGIVDEELGRDDFADLDVTGRIVMIARGLPPFPEAAPVEEQPAAGGYSHGPRTSWGTAGSIFTKVMNAKHRGAAGVVLAQDPGRAGEALLRFDAGQEARAGIPAVMAGLELAEGLLDGEYASYVERLRAGDLRVGAHERNVFVRLSADVQRGMGSAENVLARLEGADSSRVVVIGAHYDHLGLGGTGSLSSSSIGEVHNGADDNASGTAAVLELARLFAAEAALGKPPACDLYFALWSGEELGLLGSKHWVANPTASGVTVNLNMDMVGRERSNGLQVMGAGTSDAFVDWLPEAASRAELDPIVTLSGHGIGGSDHQSFLEVGTPALHLFTGVHGDYHRPSDDFEGFESEGARRVTEYARYLTKRASAATELAFIEPELGEQDDRAQKDRSWSAWFGSIPDYAGGGGGLLLSGVQEDSPAARAGLLRGDVLVEVGGVAIDTIHDFVYTLQRHKPGDVVLVRYERRGSVEEVRLTLGTRAIE